MDIIYSNIMIFGSIHLLYLSKMQLYFQNIQCYLYNIKENNKIMFYRICLNYSFKAFKILDINDEQATLDLHFFFVVYDIQY